MQLNQRGGLLKFLLILLSVLGLQSFCMASEPQILSGKFRSNNELSLVELHKWEKGDWASSEGVARRNELISQGYACYRRSPQQFQCHLKSSGGEIPDGVKSYVSDYLKNFSIEFVGPFADPKEMIKTSTEQEWWLEGNVIINQSKVRGYKWTYQFDPAKDLVVLPVSEEQPIPWFIFKTKELLHLPLQLEQKNGPNTSTVYRIEAKFVLQ